jgi:hypothetical protein
MGEGLAADYGETIHAHSLFLSFGVYRLGPSHWRS